MAGLNQMMRRKTQMEKYGMMIETQDETDEVVESDLTLFLIEDIV